MFWEHLSKLPSKHYLTSICVGCHITARSKQTVHNSTGETAARRAGKKGCSQGGTGCWRKEEPSFWPWHGDTAQNPQATEVDGPSDYGSAFQPPCAQHHARAYAQCTLPSRRGESAAARERGVHHWNVWGSTTCCSTREEGQDYTERYSSCSSYGKLWQEYLARLHSWKVQSLNTSPFAINIQYVSFLKLNFAVLLACSLETGQRTACLIVHEQACADEIVTGELVGLILLGPI